MSGFRPRKLKRPAMDKWGIFFLILSIIATIISLIPFFSAIAMLMYYFAIAIIVVITLGVILLNDKFRDSLNNTGETLSKLVDLIIYSPYFAIAGAALALIATILFARAKPTYGKQGRIIIGIIFMVIPLIILILIKTKAIQFEY